MDFVTITDRDSIDAVLSIADRRAVFMSVELTARFRDSAAAAHVLCYGISAFDHKWLQSRRHDLEVCLAYMNEHSIAHRLVDRAGMHPRQADVGRSYTETPAAESPWEFLAHVRRGRAADRGPVRLPAAA